MTTIVLAGIILLGLLALVAYVCRWLWKHSPYGRVACVVGAIFFGYNVVVSVFPNESFYRDEFASRTGLVVPPSARFTFKRASYPAFNGDYASECMFHVSKEDYQWLSKGATIAPPEGDASVGGMYWREAQTIYGRPLTPVLNGHIRKRDSDEHGGWALLDDGKTVYFWLVQT
jgi:hypothetical protein